MTTRTGSCLCGAPLPAETDERHVFVTAGTLDEPLGAGMRVRLFCGSRADWDRDLPGLQQFDERPV